MASGRTQPPASPRRTPRRCRRGCPLTRLSGRGAACARGNGAYQHDGERSGCQPATHGPIVRRLPGIGHCLQPRPGNRCSTGGGPGPPAIDHEPWRVTRRFVGVLTRLLSRLPIGTPQEALDTACTSTSPASATNPTADPRRIYEATHLVRRRPQVPADVERVIASSQAARTREHECRCG